MHMVVDVVVSLLTELDLPQKHFDADFAHIDILECEALIEAKCALVGDIAEGIQEFFSPAFEHRDVRLQSLAQIRKQLLKWLSFLDLKEVLVVVTI